ncbi:MAG: mechanosensitive ion channel family protein [Nocardioides sp.]|nr:mechanosensitive ion channel family protein [Nocardioides sp.]
MELPSSATVCEPHDALSCRFVYQWTENETWASAATFLIGKPTAVVGIILIGLLARWLAHRAIGRVTHRAANGVVPTGLTHGLTRGRLGRSPRTATAGTFTTAHHAERRVQRAETMASLLKSITSGLIIAIVIVMVLAEIGINVAPIIASAGILGLAIGFGAQSLVSDFLAGIFMITEDQYGVGDVVDLGDAIGTVEAVTLRVTRLRDVEGTVWYVRNGEIMRVGNQSQNWARAVLDIGVAYDEDLARVKRVLGEVAHEMWEDDDYRGIVIEEPQVWGIQGLDADQVTVRVVLKTAPLEQWAVARTMRERIKARFDYEGIEIPFPQRVVWHREQRVEQDKQEPAGQEPAGASGPA